MMDGIIKKKSDIGELTTLSGARCRYGMFTRHGGVSSGPYASLNVGRYVGDEAEMVSINRRKVREAMGVSALLTARQVHGQGIYCLTEPLCEDREVDGFDALITNHWGLGLMVQQADCQAVLLFDAKREVIAAIHCGWRGSVAKIIPQVVATMTSTYGTVAADLQAIISPSLGPCCAEFVNFRNELPGEFQKFMVGEDHFDFWRITRSQLIDAGVREEQVRMSGYCTCCSSDYFSYRRASRQGAGVTGRNCSVIALVKK